MCYVFALCFLIVSLILCVWSLDKLNLLQPIEHEVRFTKFGMSINESYGKVLETSVKQYYTSQFLDIHYIIYKKVKFTHIYFQADICKELYIDCYNLRSFDIRNLCGNEEKAYTIFLKVGYLNRPITCDPQGEYIHRNVTINLHNTMIGFMEKWWEKSFKFKCIYYNSEEHMVITVHGEIGFVTFRRRNRKTIF